MRSVDPKLTDSIVNGTPNITRRIRHIVCFASRLAIGHDDTKNTLILPDCFGLLIKEHLDIRIVLAVLGNFGLKERQALIVKAKVGVASLHPKLLFKFGFGKSEGIKFLPFDPYSIHAIFTVKKLNNLSSRSTEGTIVSRHDGFHRLNKTTLNVTSLGSLTCSIDQTFATSHGVEKEFLGTQATKVRVFDKASTFGAKIVLGKVRERSATKAVRNTLTLNVLLSHTRNNLRNVNEGTFTASCDHRLD